MNAPICDELIDWTDNEQVVRAALPEVSCEYIGKGYECVLRTGKNKAGAIYEHKDIAWEHTRKHHIQVQLFESLNNSEKGVKE